MAATDQFYRSQKTLDVVFGVSCVLMLLSLLVMFYQDQKKEWKDDQRLARDVEEAMAQRTLIASFPDQAKIEAAEAAVKAAQDELNKEENKAALKRLEGELEEKLAVKVRAEARFLEVKAEYDSKMSLLAIATEHRNAADESHRKAHEAEVEQLTKRVAEIKARMDAELRNFQDAETKYDVTKKALDTLKKPVTDSVAELKRLYTEFDRTAKLVSQKRWGFGDAFRNLPVLDAFNPPVRIHQFTLEELPIEYGSFKYVTRYDRCMSCHIAIDRPAYTREDLASLRQAPSDLAEKLKNAQQSINRRYELIQDKKEKELLDIDLGSLRTVPQLADRHVNEFCAHPRLDLFVDDNSPHPKEKFGCTICHQGQGSATSFVLAAHTPNNAKTTGEWVKEYHWASQHYWDFPMLPKRFVEASCVKCHHQITDLVRDGSKEEAPKLLRGYNLVKDNGCFGCHEISGMKSGRTIGPDLRLEPWPPLDDPNLTPAERVRATSDPLNPPGTMRKVGPSLRRLGEKTHEEWVRKWVSDPRGFRPDTKMPHFYGLSNNRDEALPPEQKGFPEAEIHAIAHYLMRSSRDYLEDDGKGARDAYRRLLLAREVELQKEVAKALMPADKAKRAQELDDVKRRLELYNKSTRPPLDDKRITLENGATVALPAEDKDQTAQVGRGRQLFTERGCLACHSHKGTETAGQGVPALAGDAQFGPNLSQMTAKLGTKPGDRASARRWLVQWIVNPNLHHPRTFMPVTHLTVEQAADVAAWILSQTATWKADDVPAPSRDTLKALARVWLEKSRTQAEIDDLLGEKNPGWLNGVKPESDESLLKGGLSDDNLKMYVGKKAVNNLGCYACHDIPGFENAKPIGTPLNEWGKKDGERLAFEDIGAYIKKHYQTVKSLDDAKDVHGHPIHYEQGKAPYEEFYLDQINHHSRIGFLHQKLREPRSYDHDRVRKWDERLRMPQFKFARVDRRPGETDDEFHVRAEKAEAEAREAVMTFILGLVAEPIPAKYVYNPGPDRTAEVRGRQVLDKFNCAGCHLVRPGVYEFKKTKDVLDYLDGLANSSASAAKNEYGYHEFHHSAFRGRPTPQPDRVVARATPLLTQQLEGATFVRLSEALRFTNAENQTRDIMAGLNVGFGTEETVLKKADVIYENRPYGGTFANLLVPYLQRKDKQNFGDDPKALAAGPPPLFRQGERAQPDWLFRFLRNPHAIRPITVLRMPKFNMSDDEAMALVNYFAATDKLYNPAEGLAYPYVATPQRDDAYWQAKSREYVGRLRQHGLYDKRVAELKPIWEDQIKQEAAQTDKSIASAEAALKEAKDDAKKAAQQTLDDLKRQRAANTLQAKQQEWEERHAYATDAYRLLVNYNTPCLSCHRVGNTLSTGEQGPPLEQVWDRLRPQWTEKWLANPPRMFSYDTTMPKNFLPADAGPQGLSKVYPEFVGTPLEQATAVRDLLMNFPRIAELPANRAHRPRPAAAGADKTGGDKK